MNFDEITYLTTPMLVDEVYESEFSISRGVICDSRAYLEKQMELLPSDILAQVYSRLNNDTLENISRTHLWFSVRESIINQQADFWKLRVEHKLQRVISQRCSDSEMWKEAYYYFLEQPENRRIPNTLVVHILEELDYDLSTYDNMAIRLAAQDGKADVVRLLLKNPSIDPNALYDQAIVNSASCGHIQVVELLLDSCTALDIPLRIACRDGKMNIVKFLLSVDKCDVTIWNNDCCRTAVYYGQLDILEYLLEDPRVQATIQMDNLVQEACESRQISTLKFLISRGVRVRSRIVARIILTQVAQTLTLLSAMIILTVILFC